MRLRTLTVTELNRYIKKLLTMDPILNHVYLKGEISNFKHHSSGHAYFSLKDETSKVNCVFFRENCSKLKFEPYNGLNVIVKGYVSIFERDGQYQLYVMDMEPEGVGALYIAFEQLKLKLEQEGIFDSALKKKIPSFPQNVAVVTSPTGAAIQDIFSVIKRRNPNVNILLYPVLVQGEGAAAQIAEAIENLNHIGDTDVIIVGRGGGSIEELWAFNEEIVARSIYASHIPIISAIGHETDYTIADFAADMRAPTPSAAAEMVVPNLIDIKHHMHMLYVRLNRSFKYTLNEKESNLRGLSSQRALQAVTTSINEKRQFCDTLYKNIENRMMNDLEKRKINLEAMVYKLQALNPLSTLRRGYAIAMDKDAHSVIHSAEKLNLGDNICLILEDGRLICQVQGIKKGEDLLNEGFLKQ